MLFCLELNSCLFPMLTRLTHTHFRIFIFGISLIACFLLILIKLPKWICPILLCQSQLSFSFPKQHLSLLISSSIYMLFGFLEVVATNFPDSSLCILQSFEVNVSMCPWSHIWLTLSRLCFMFSVSKTLFVAMSLFPRMIVPFPSILDELSLLNVIVPFLLVMSERCSCFWTCA